MNTYPPNKSSKKTKKSKKSNKKKPKKAKEMLNNEGRSKETEPTLFRKRIIIRSKKFKQWLLPHEITWLHRKHTMGFVLQFLVQ